MREARYDRDVGSLVELDELRLSHPPHQTHRVTQSPFGDRPRELVAKRPVPSDQQRAAWGHIFHRVAPGVQEHVQSHPRHEPPDRDRYERFGFESQAAAHAVNRAGGEAVEVHSWGTTLTFHGATR